MNYGLRWEPFFGLMNKDKSAVQFDDALSHRASKPSGSQMLPYLLASSSMAIRISSAARAERRA